MSNPSPEAIAKLPKWVQEHIGVLERQRKNAVDALNTYLQSQKPSGVSKCT